MNTIEGFEQLLKNGETKKAIELLPWTGMGGRYFQLAIEYGNTEVMDFLVNTSGSNYSFPYMYHNAVITNDFNTMKWLLSHKIGLNVLNTTKWLNAPLDCCKSREIMYLMIDYGATGTKSSSKLATLRYLRHKAVLRIICEIIIKARNGHKDTNVIIAKVVWGMRLIGVESD